MAIIIPKERQEGLTDVLEMVNARLKEVQDEMDADCTIDEMRIDSEAIRATKLHSKYNRIFSDECVNLNKFYDLRKKTKTERYLYYLKKQPSSYYAKYGQVHLDLTKTDIENYHLPSDEIMVMMNAIVTSQKSLVDSVERMMKEIHDRAYLLKTALDYRKFESGA